MGRKTYTAEQHQKAFEVWYRTRNWSTVSKELGTTWTTAKRWGESDYPCQWSCPWHDYDKLMDERDAAHQARVELLEQGNMDPVAHDMAIRDAIAKPRAKADPTKVYNSAPLKICRSDLERMGHWEFLWSKVYFHATGIVTSWSEFQGQDTMPEFERLELQEKIRDALGGGLAATSLESAVRMLKMIQDQLDNLQGARRRTADDKPGSPKNTMTIEALRKLKRTIKTTSQPKLVSLLNSPEHDESSDRAAV